MKKTKSELPLNYITVKTTKSRIDKGLLAIPVSLIELFPKTGNKIFLVNEKGNTEVPLHHTIVVAVNVELED